MESNAPGQLLGFSFQFPRALCHLLKSGPGDVVSIEVLGDVATSKSGGEVISEEDKSSIKGNPLTDRSIDLWKTFSNWIKAINDGVLDVGKTKFILYCNESSGREGIVHKFSSAGNHEEVQNAIDCAKRELKDITTDHTIWEYYNYVVNKNEPLLLEVVAKFELQVGNGAGYDEVSYEIQRKHVPKSQINFLMNYLGGWLQKQVSEKIKSKELAKISWEDFNHQFMVVFDRARRLELIDFTLQEPIQECDKRKQVKISPCYLRQLEKIEASDDDILEAVSDFLRADVNRSKWIENEIIDENVASDFESKLIIFWGNQRTRIEITEKNLAETKRGKLLFMDCRSRQERIRDSDPPSSTIAGTYHALANKPLLGWHPNWEQLFPKQKDE